MAEIGDYSSASRCVPTETEHSKRPVVSIGMPVYNGERFLRQALDSLLSQTYRDFELIISDNASNDSTPAICAEYAARDSRIRYIRQPKNLGASANFKLVFDEALGQYFTWAAHDDVRSLNYIELTVNNFKPDDACVTGCADFIDWDGRPLYTITVSSFAKNGLLKFFMESEFKARTMYMYGLFSVEVLRTADWTTIENKEKSWHWNDAHFLYSILRSGSLRTVQGARITYRSKRDKVAKKASSVDAAWPRWLQLLLAHPPSYYKPYWDLTDRNKRAFLLVLLPVKVIKSQVDAWYVACKRLVRMGVNHITSKQRAR
jgi:glycosyltransferase involved in cell wall biosynthesis